MVDLGELGSQEGLGTLLQVHGRTEVEAGGADELDRDGPLVELRDEVGAEAGVADRSRQGGKRRGRDGGGPMGEAPFEHHRET